MRAPFAHRWRRCVWLRCRYRGIHAGGGSGSRTPPRSASTIVNWPCFPSTGGAKRWMLSYSTSRWPCEIPCRPSFMSELYQIGGPPARHLLEIYEHVGITSTSSTTHELLPLRTVTDPSLAGRPLPAVLWVFPLQPRPDASVSCLVSDRWECVGRASYRKRKTCLAELAIFRLLRRRGGEAEGRLCRSLEGIS